MKINIYYGGRGMIEDPAIYVIEQIEKVFEELAVGCTVYNIYENKHKISTLPQTIAGADGIILATTVEWLGIGGYMAQFLDALWLYGDKARIADLYMQPVVIATSYGEREAMTHLENAWAFLGGKLAGGLCGYVDDVRSFKQDGGYRQIIEKKTEDFFRTIQRKLDNLPTSNRAITQTLLSSRQMRLTPQESEQLSEIAADDSKVRQQKSDVFELSQMYSNMILGSKDSEEGEFVTSFVSRFRAKPGFAASYLFLIEGKDKPLILEINGTDLKCCYGEIRATDVQARLSAGIMEEITSGRMSFTRAFSVGDMSAKGKFASIRMLDSLFPFS